MKLSKFLSLALCTCLTLGTVFAGNVTTMADTTVTYSSEVTNLALNGTATVSSVENISLDGKYAIDGDMSTRWSSAWSDNQWITVDLGITCKLGCVSVYWEAARASKIEVAISDDGINWFTCAGVGVGSLESIVPMYNRPARYVRVKGITRATQYGYSIYELTILGYASNVVEETTTQAPTTTAEPTTTAPVYSTEVTNLALGKTATASTIENADYNASMAVDGNLNTRWSSQFLNNQSLTIDLGDTCILGCISINWEAAFAKTYSIAISDDGVNWFTCTTMHTDTLSDTCDMLYQRRARYIRVTGEERATQYGISIYEVSVLGYAPVK